MDGKVLSWAREYEPYIRAQVKAGLESVESYKRFITEQQLAEYFPEVRFSLLPVVLILMKYSEYHLDGIGCAG